MSGYLSRLLAAYQAGHLNPGEVTQVDVAHANDCPVLRGGDCTCDPGLTLVTRDGVTLLKPDGSTERGPTQWSEPHAN